MSTRANDSTITLPEAAPRTEDLNRLVRPTRLEGNTVDLSPGDAKTFKGTDKQGVRRKTFLVTNTHASARAELFDFASQARVMTLFPARTSEPLDTDADLTVKNPDPVETITLDICEIYPA